MRYLLDTNIFVYMANEQESLSCDVHSIIEDYDNVLCMSIESLRELIVAYRNKGLLTKRWKTEKEMITAIINSNIVILPLKSEHMLTYASMQINEAQNHKDPSDHVIIAQAMTERIPLISSDRRFEFYCEQGLELILNNK